MRRVGSGGAGSTTLCMQVFPHPSQRLPDTWCAADVLRRRMRFAASIVSNAPASSAPASGLVGPCARLTLCDVCHTRFAQAVTRVKPFICTMPLRLDDGWNTVTLNLQVS